MQVRDDTDKPRIGWIGIGKMGSPMVRAVLASGYAVALSEPLPENRASALAAGATLASSLEELVRMSEVIVTTVANDTILHDIVFGPGGLAQHMRPSQILIDFSTVSPRVSADVAEVFDALEVDYLRAPVSGSTVTAQAGQLTVIVSGPKPAWRRVEPVLAAISAKRFWVGGHDEARYLKLAINVLIGGTSALLGEALAVGQCSGLPLPLLLDVICQSAAGSPLLDYKRDAILTDDFDPSFSVAQMIKDLELIGEVATEAGLPLDLTDNIRRRFERAQRDGLADQDYFVLVREHLRSARMGNRQQVRRSARA